MGDGIRPERQSRDGDAFEVDLALADLVAVNPTLADTAEGLEVADVDAVTMPEDVWLEIVSIEVGGGDGERPGSFFWRRR